MQIPALASQAPTVVVDSAATVVRGFSTEVRSDIPPVQEPEGVVYTKDRPADSSTYEAMFNSRAKSQTSEDASAESQNAARQDPAKATEGDTKTKEASAEDRASLGRAAVKGSGAEEMTPEQQAQVTELRQRDAEVRQHEMAHQAVGGQFTGAASYEYQTGPDGKRYAVGGEVGVDTGSAGSPEATIAKARQVKAAALAPAQPSGQDLRVAQGAEKMIAQAALEQRAAERSAASPASKSASIDGDAHREQGANPEQASAAGLNQEKRVEEQRKDERQVKEDKKQDDEKEAAQAASLNSDSGVPAAQVGPSKQASPSAQAVGSSSSGNQAGQGGGGGDGKAVVNQSDKPTAKESLEKILLASGSLAEQANRAGYIQPDSPGGKSGFLSFVV
ncbi:hypothetical protein HDN1F_02100 [gamma proteobacterium HdN1]|nr:hypothetical protein HDN1F_02100 [gamma proteobacterium HdN1]